MINCIIFELSLHFHELIYIEDGLGATELALKAIPNVGYIQLVVVKAGKVFDCAHGYII